MKRILIASVVCACALLVGGQNAQALLIDSFDVTTQSLGDDTDDGSGVESSFSASEAIRGRRDITLDTTGTTIFPGPTEFGTAVDVNVAGSGVLLFSSFGATSDGAFTLRYDGGDDTVPDDATVSSESFTPVVDLTELSSNDRFELVYATNTLTPLTVTIFSAGGSSTFVGSLADTGGATMFETSSIFFADFTGTADLTMVTALVFAFDPPEATTLRLDSINAVPEPTSIALLGMGAFGLMGYGWRRKKKVVVDVEDA